MRRNERTRTTSITISTTFPVSYYITYSKNPFHIELFSCSMMMIFYADRASPANRELIHPLSGVSAFSLFWIPILCWLWKFLFLCDRWQTKRMRMTVSCVYVNQNPSIRHERGKIYEALLGWVPTKVSKKLHYLWRMDALERIYWINCIVRIFLEKILL